MVFAVLGPLHVADSTISAGQQSRLLGLLLIERHRIVPTPELATWVLDGTRTEDAAHVQVLVARLRRTLRERDLPAVIETSGRGYRMCVDDGALDADRFEALVGDAGTSRSGLGEGLRLWRGDVLAGLGLEAHPGVVRLEEMRAATLERAFAIDVELDVPGVLAELLPACRRYPARERLQVLGMTALHVAGRQAEALALYQRARHHLVADIGLEPGEAIQAAQLAVLRRDTGKLLQLAVGRDEVAGSAGRAPMGASPVRTFQPGALRYSTSFVGRASDVAAVRRGLAEPGVLTLLGPGGIGKTRLTVETLATFEGGEARPVWFADLASLGDGDEVTRFVARVVGARLEPGRDALDALVDALAGVSGVLVLDSCEARVGEIAELIRGLRAGCHDLTVLATSRRALGVGDEKIHVLGPLERDSEAPELFQHRAADRDPGFVLDVDGLDALCELCDRLDGLPLAIELAAARIRTVGPAELLDHLDERFALLRDEDRPDDRHRSLEATIEWSYALLAVPAQRLLRRLAAFAGSVELHHLTAVCGLDARPSDIGIDSLAELVDRSMLVTERAAGPTRYRMLDTIKAFARERARAEGELEATELRHAQHYADQIAGLRGELRGSSDAVAAARLDQIWPEVVVAVGRCIERNDTTTLAGLVTGLGFEAVFRERSEIVEWADHAVTMAGALELPAADELLGTSALADWGYGHFDRGLRRAEQAITIHRSRRTGLTPDVAAALPLHTSMRGDLPASLVLLRSHASEALTDGETFAQTHMLICESMALGFAGQSDEADLAMRQADQLAARLGCRLLHTIAAFTRTIVVLDRRPDEAAGHARHALLLAESIRATWFLTAATNYLVAALARTDEPALALEPLRASLDRQLGGRTVQSVANTIRNTIVLIDRLGTPADAVPLLGWLEINRPSIPGTPGMRAHPQTFAAQVRARVGDAAFHTGQAFGASLSVTEVIRTALATIAR